MGTLSNLLRMGLWMGTWGDIAMVVGKRVTSWDFRDGIWETDPSSDGGLIDEKDINPFRQSYKYGGIDGGSGYGKIAVIGAGLGTRHRAGFCGDWARSCDPRSFPGVLAEFPSEG
jgi:hypothetical protein